MHLTPFLRNDLQAAILCDVALVIVYCKVPGDRPRSKSTLRIPKGMYFDFGLI